MKIILYGINFSPDLTGVGKYSGEMAHWLAEKGHDVRVITAPPYYPEWRIKSEYGNRYSTTSSQNMSVIRCPLYVPSKLTTLRRLCHLISFSLTSFFPVLSSAMWKPDLVIQIAPTLFCSVQTLIMSKISGAKSIIHIQDFEVDAMFGLSMIEFSVLKHLMCSIEKKIFNSFQIVSTISEGMLKRASEKGVKDEKLLFFPNWSDVDSFLNQIKCKEFLKNLGVATDKNIVLYSGNMGEKQGLESVVFAAELMSKQKNIQFVLVGEGSEKLKLKRLSGNLNLNNIVFLPLVPNEMLPKLLASADCHIVVQRKGAADAVLPSKLTNILAVGGNAVITASKETTLGKLCSDVPEIAVLVRPECVKSLVKGINQALVMEKPNKVAQRYAQDFLDKERILSRFFDQIS